MGWKLAVCIVYKSKSKACRRSYGLLYLHVSYGHVLYVYGEYVKNNYFPLSSFEQSQQQRAVENIELTA